MRYAVFIKLFDGPNRSGCIETFASHTDARVYADMMNRQRREKDRYYVVPV